jgi:hypothetical protein
MVADVYLCMEQTGVVKVLIVRQEDVFRPIFFGLLGHGHGVGHSDTNSGKESGLSSLGLKHRITRYIHLGLYVISVAPDMAID